MTHRTLSLSLSPNCRLTNQSEKEGKRRIDIKRKIADRDMKGINSCLLCPLSLMSLSFSFFLVKEDDDIINGLMALSLWCVAFFSRERDKSHTSWQPPFIKTREAKSILPLSLWMDDDSMTFTGERKEEERKWSRYFMNMRVNRQLDSLSLLLIEVFHVYKSKHVQRAKRRTRENNITETVMTDDVKTA